MSKKNKYELVTAPWWKLQVESSTYGNRKRYLLIQRELLKMLIGCWMRFKLHTACMARPLKY